MNSLQHLLDEVTDTDSNKIKDVGLLWRMTSQDFIERCVHVTP